MGLLGAFLAGLVHVVLVLLRPEAEQPERHLRRLAGVTRLVRSGEAVERLQ